MFLVTVIWCYRHCFVTTMVTVSNRLTFLVESTYIWIIASVAVDCLAKPLARIRKETKGPDAHWANICLFCEKSVTSCLRQARPVIFRLPNLVKAHQTSKTPSSRLRAGQIFVRREIQWQMMDDVNQETLLSSFSRSTSIEVRSPVKLLLEEERCSRTRWSLHCHSRSSNCFCWS